MALTHVTCTCCETCFAYRDALGVRVPQIVSYFNDSLLLPLNILLLSVLCIQLHFRRGHPCPCFVCSTGYICSTEGAC